MTELLGIRATDARLKSEFFSGKSDTHPHGLSGMRFILPYENDKGCWDTAPSAYEMSEWAQDWYPQLHG